MKHLHTSEVSELSAFGAILPYNFSDVIEHGDHPIAVEVTRMVGEGLDPDSPGDVTVITPKWIGRKRQGVA